jgi:pilus assembly protein Flp/PilA
LGIKKLLTRFIQDEEGATAVEYAVMIVLIIVVCLTVVGFLGQEVKNAFTTVQASMAAAQ